MGTGLESAHDLRGLGLAATLEAAPTERFDEDWFRNPCTGPFLAERFARGDDAEAADFGETPFALGGHARDLLEL